MVIGHLKGLNKWQKYHKESDDLVEICFTHSETLFLVCRLVTVQCFVQLVSQQCCEASYMRYCKIPKISPPKHKSRKSQMQISFH